MTNNFDPNDDRDYRTLDVNDRVVILTKKKFLSQDKSITDSVQNHHNSDLYQQLYESHDFEPGVFYVGDDKRHLSKAQLPNKHKCTCGYTLKPKDNGFRHQALIECQCDQCRARIFVEIPYTRSPLL